MVLYFLGFKDGWGEFCPSWWSWIFQRHLFLESGPFQLPGARQAVFSRVPHPPRLPPLGRPGQVGVCQGLHRDSSVSASPCTGPPRACALTCERGSSSQQPSPCVCRKADAQAPAILQILQVRVRLLAGSRPAVQGALHSGASASLAHGRKSSWFAPSWRRWKRSKIHKASILLMPCAFNADSSVWEHLEFLNALWIVGAGVWLFSRGWL